MPSVLLGHAPEWQAPGSLRLWSTFPSQGSSSHTSSQEWQRDWEPGEWAQWGSPAYRKSPQQLATELSRPCFRVIRTKWRSSRQVEKPMVRTPADDAVCPPTRSRRWGSKCHLPDVSGQSGKPSNPQPAQSPDSSVRSSRCRLGPRARRAVACRSGTALTKAQKAHLGIEPSGSSIGQFGTSYNEEVRPHPPARVPDPGDDDYKVQARRSSGRNAASKNRAKRNARCNARATSGPNSSSHCRASPTSAGRIGEEKSTLNRDPCQHPKYAGPSQERNKRIQAAAQSAQSRVPGCSGGSECPSDAEPYICRRGVRQLPSFHCASDTPAGGSKFSTARLRRCLLRCLLVFGLWSCPFTIQRCTSFPDGESWLCGLRGSSASADSQFSSAKSSESYSSYSSSSPFRRNWGSSSRYLTDDLAIDVPNPSCSADEVTPVLYRTATRLATRNLPMSCSRNEVFASSDPDGPDFAPILFPTMTGFNLNHIPLSPPNSKRRDGSSEEQRPSERTSRLRRGCR